MAALYPASPPVSGPDAVGRSRLRVLVTAAALAFSVALELTGPPQSFLSSLRLPLAVLVMGALWAQARWRGERASSRRSVPMATPCLILSSTAGIAVATVKLASVSPSMACALLSFASAGCCLAVGLLVTDGRRQGEARPRDRGKPLAGRAPGKRVRPAAADA